MGWTVDGIALEVEAFSFYVGISVNIQSVIVNATHEMLFPSDFMWLVTWFRRSSQIL